jgi:hypothetical protein
VSRWLRDSDDDVPFDQATNVAGAQLALTLIEDTVTGLREWIEKLTIVAVSEAALLQAQQSRAPNAVILRLEAQFTESDGDLETLAPLPKGIDAKSLLASYATLAELAASEPDQGVLVPLAAPPAAKTGAPRVSAVLVAPGPMLMSPERVANFGTSVMGCETG